MAGEDNTGSFSFQVVRRSEDNETLGIIGFPGSAAPQCGISSDVREDNCRGEQPLRRQYSRGYLLHFDSEYPSGGLVESFNGLSLEKITLSWKNAAAQ